MSGIWIGIDPGPRFTGIALRLGTQCLGWRTIEREHDETEIGVGPEYYAAITYSITVLTDAATRSGHGEPRSAIEGVSRPVAFIDGKPRRPRPLDLIALGAVFGAIHTPLPDAVIVRADHNGRGVYGQYPLNLVSAGEKRARNWERKECGRTSLESHSRSAWSVAGKAALLDRRAA